MGYGFNTLGRRGLRGRRGGKIHRVHAATGDAVLGRVAKGAQGRWPVPDGSARYRGCMRFNAFAAYSAEVVVTAEVIPEMQNSNYESGIVQIGEEVWHIRTARNIPTEPGAFVAFWQRHADGNTTPFSDDDPAAGLLVFVAQHDRRGVFRFTGARLTALGITSGRRPGKRGFRVYPNWRTGLNVQATTTQRAQAPAFQEF